MIPADITNPTNDICDRLVLIVGAGPSGLAAAAALTKLGIEVRLIDKNHSRSDKSKALGVQAGTLECLTEALDAALPTEMIASGKQALEAWIHLDDAPPLEIKLSTIPSRYNFILILAQSETERILEGWLNRSGVVVERDTELLSVKDQGPHAISEIKLPSGQIQTVTSAFVIGCDGAHSAVRKLMQIPFEGGAYEGDFILGDVELNWKWPYDSVQNFVSKRGVIASFPMKGHRRYRLILIPKNGGPVPETPNIEWDEFRGIVDFLGRGQIEVLDPTWLTRFRVHHRMVKTFQSGRVFLAGDAAHIHSPAGGQGMNTGIQDSLNLAHKIAKVIGGTAALDSLRAYDRERIPVARQVLRSTDLVFKLALLRETKPVAFMRRAVLPPIVGSSWVQKRVVAAISEVAIARREIARYKQR